MTVELRFPQILLFIVQHTKWKGKQCNLVNVKYYKKWKTKALKEQANGFGESIEKIPEGEPSVDSAHHHKTRRSHPIKATRFLK